MFSTINSTPIDRRYPKTDRAYYAAKAKKQRQKMKEYREQFMKQPGDKKLSIAGIPVDKELYDFVIAECEKQQCSKSQFILSAILVYRRLAKENQ